LGSNEALAVAGAMAVNEFFGGPLTKRELLPLIKTANCSIYDKVSLAALSASLLGSCMLVRDEESIDIQRVSIPRGLYFAVLVPNIQTEGIYPELVSVQNSIKQSANLSAFILGLNNTDFNLIGRSMHDFIIEPHFSNSIPFYKEMKAASIDLGALGFGLSGTGSAVYAFCNSSVKAEACLELMKEFYVKNKIRCSAWISAVNMEGAELE
jgi:homoserine kinase